MNYNQAELILEKIQCSSLSNLKNDLINKAIRYARIRADWEFMSIEEKSAQNLLRTSAHNAFIDSCNILIRNMKKAGEDISWESSLTEDRKIIGDLACYIHCIIGILNR